MIVTLGLLRHGRSTGQGPDSELLPEGAAQVARLGRLLAREGWVPLAAFSSPYRRARDTARIVLGELASDVPLRELEELTPDRSPGRALDALLAQRLPAGPILVVSHNPLLSHLAEDLAGEPFGFDTGSFAEIRLDTDTRRGWLARDIHRGNL